MLGRPESRAVMSLCSLEGGTVILWRYDVTLGKVFYFKFSACIAFILFKHFDWMIGGC